MKTLTLLSLTVLIALAGCQEENKVWGKGELNDNWVSHFGKGNLARLNFVQTEKINEFGQLLAEANVRLEKLETAESRLAKHIEDMLGEARFIGGEPNVITWQDEGLFGGQLLGYCDDGSIVWKDKNATEGLPAAP